MEGVMMPVLSCVLRVLPAWLAASALALLLLPVPAHAASMEPDTELSGKAYRSFELIAPVPDYCRKVCEKDTGCQAWMFSWPGKKGKRAKCFLFSAVEGKRKDTCCIAGYRQKGSSFGDAIARWFGGGKEEDDTAEAAKGNATTGGNADGTPAAATGQARRDSASAPSRQTIDTAALERKRRFCTEYAEKAIQANRKARELGCGFRGGLWGASRRGYYNWCMKNPQRNAERNTQRRAAALQRCERTLAARPPEPPARPEPETPPEPSGPEMTPVPAPPPEYPPHARPAPPPAASWLWRQARFEYSWLKRSGPGPRVTPWRPTLSGKCPLVRACECPQGNTCRVYPPGSIAVSWPLGCDGPPAYYVCRVRQR